MLPIWSAAVDPRVVAARALLSGDDAAHLIDITRDLRRLVCSGTTEHLLVERHATLLRIDIIEGTVTAGPSALYFDVRVDARLPERIATIRAFATGGLAQAHRRLAARLQALHAADLRAAGARLKDIADGLLGPGAWPGAGEHRKSAVRRMIAAGEHMVRTGPRPILSGLAAAENNS